MSFMRSAGPPMPTAIVVPCRLSGVLPHHPPAALHALLEVCICDTPQPSDNPENSIEADRDSITMCCLPRTYRKIDCCHAVPVQVQPPHGAAVVQAVQRGDEQRGHHTRPQQEVRPRPVPPGALASRNPQGLQQSDSRWCLGASCSRTCAMPPPPPIPTTTTSIARGWGTASAPRHHPGGRRSRGHSGKPRYEGGRGECAQQDLRSLRMRARCDSRGSGVMMALVVMHVAEGGQEVVVEAGGGGGGAEEPGGRGEDRHGRGGGAEGAQVGGRGAWMV